MIKGHRLRQCSIIWIVFRGATGYPMDPLEFARKRKDEVLAIENDIRAARSSLTKQPFQRIPRFLRRRAASHNVKRLPVRFRYAGKNSDTVPKAKNDRKVVTIKRVKGSNTDARELSTHKWHAKRCRIEAQFGWKIPICNNEKMLKACLAASDSGCFVYDMTYYRYFERAEDSKHTALDTHIGAIYGQGCVLAHPILLKYGNFKGCDSEQKEKCIFFLAGPKSEEVLKKKVKEEFRPEQTFGWGPGIVAIVDWDRGYDLWKQMIYSGARYGSLLEFTAVMHEHRFALFPDDSFSTAALSFRALACMNELEATVRTMPPSKYDLARLQERVNRAQVSQSLSEIGASSMFRVSGSGVPDVYGILVDSEGTRIGVVTSSWFSRKLGCVCCNAITLAQKPVSPAMVRNIDGRTVVIELLNSE